MCNCSKITSYQTSSGFSGSPAFPLSKSRHLSWRFRPCAAFEEQIDIISGCRIISVGAETKGQVRPVDSYQAGPGKQCKAQVTDITHPAEQFRIGRYRFVI